MIKLAPPGLPQLVHAVGDANFAKQLILTLEDTVPVDHVTLFHFDANLTPRLVTTASRTRINIAARAGRTWQTQQLYRHDPGTQQVRQLSEDRQPLLFSLRRDDIHDPVYRSQLYDRYHLLERISIIQHIGTTWCAVNLYRGARAGYFTPKELKQLNGLAGLLTALAERHIQFSQTKSDKAIDQPDQIESFLATLAQTLSARERAVCAQSLRGLTVKMIAAQLGIAPATVATLRHRAFQKLEISSLNELFILCISTLSRAS